jgi:predicted DNA-binding transcriptional regulator
MCVCCECCVLTGRGLCDELITRPGSPNVCVREREREREGEREVAYTLPGLLRHMKTLLKRTQIGKYIIRKGWVDGPTSRTRNPRPLQNLLKI